MVIVSACLVGINCRYDGGNNADQKVIELVSKGFAIPEDVTMFFKKGARETLQIVKLTNCQKAILK
jgi:uncharacterized protein YbbK (DUF523 family)